MYSIFLSLNTDHFWKVQGVLDDRKSTTVIEKDQLTLLFGFRIGPRVEHQTSRTILNPIYPTDKL